MMFLSCSHNNQPYLVLSSKDLCVYFFILRLTEALRLKNVSKCNVRNDGMTHIQDLNWCSILQNVLNCVYFIER